MRLGWLMVVTVMAIGSASAAVIGIWTSASVPKRAGHADPQQLARLLRRNGFSVRLLSTADLSSPETLSPEKFALVILPYGAHFPTEAVDNFRRYLKAGGRFVSLGGYTFDETRDMGHGAGGRWEWEKVAHEKVQVEFSRNRIRIVVPDDVPVDWHRVRVFVPLRVDWRYLLTGKVRTDGIRDGYGAYLAADYYDANGNRITFQQTQILRRTDGWRELGVVLRIPENAATVAINAIVHGHGAAEFTDFSVKPVVNARWGDARDWMHLDPEQFAIFDPSFRIDGATVLERGAGRETRDEVVLGMKEPMKGYAAVGLIGSNNPVNPQAWARLVPVSVARDKFGCYLGPAFSVVHHFAGPYAGSTWAFCGMESHDLTKFPKFRQVLAQVIRRMLHGVYLHSLRPSFWTYRKGETASVSVKVRNDGVAPQTVTVRMEVAPMPEPLGMDKPVAIGEKTVTLSPREQMTVMMQWRIPQNAAPLYAVRAWLGGSLALPKTASASTPLDEIWSGFCVWDESLLRNATPIAWRNNALCEWDESKKTWQPKLWLGTNQTGVLFAPEATWENPLQWELEFALMLKMGLKILRVLHISHFAGDLEKPTETFWRRYDALVLMTHRHGLVLMPTLHDWMGVSVSDETLRKQCAFVRQVGARYKDAPRILWDIENEAWVEFRDHPSLHRLFNEWLGNRYGSDEKLQRAWGENVKLGKVRYAEHKPRGWDDLKFRDIQHFRRWLIERWVKANVQALRESGAKQPVTDEIDWKVCGDHYEAARWLDFANLHYYGDRSPNAIATYLKFHDRSARRQGLAVGEFGARNHPSFRFGGWGYAPTEEVVRHFANVPLLTFGLQGTMVLNWDWKDMEACIFPWGLMHQHGIYAVARDMGHGTREKRDAGRGTQGARRGRKVWEVEAALKVAGKTFAAIAKFLEQAEFKAYEPRKVAVVIPDEHLLGAEGEFGFSGTGPRGRISAAVYRAIEAMLRLKVHFRIVREWEITAGDRSFDYAVAVFPIPFVWRDDTFAAVKRFVADGGIAIITGDFTFDPDRKRTKTKRLKELLGFSSVDGIPSPFALATTPFIRCLTVDEALAVTGWQAKPCVRMKGDGVGQALAVTERGEPVIVARRLGKGLAVFCADAPELRDIEETVRLYGALLRWVGVKVAGKESLMALGDGRSVFVAANPSERFEAMEINADGKRLRFTVPPQGTAMVAVKGEEQGAIFAGALEINEGGNWRPLAQSDGLTLLWRTPKMAWLIPTQTGDLRLRWLHPKAHVTVCDLLTGKVLRRFTVKASANTLSLTVPPELVFAEWWLR
ncbi:MAG: hypothetical protein HZLCBSQH_000585 [Candidatus Fervidibacterota bacterium]